MTGTSKAERLAALFDAPAAASWIKTSSGSSVEAVASSAKSDAEEALGKALVLEPKTPDYTGQEWFDGMQELLSRPTDGSKVAYIFILMGQSNADGDTANTAEPLISAAPIYPDHAFMLAGGPRMWTVEEGETELVPLRETVVNRGGASRQAETPLSGWVNHTIRDWDTAWGERPTIGGMIIAIGGRPYIGNKKGTYAFQNISDGLPAMVAALRAQGFTDIRTVRAWVGSESDTHLPRMTVERFKKQMRQLDRDSADVIRRITGELVMAPLLAIQPSNVINGQPWNQPVRQALVELDGEGAIVLAGPAYHLPMSGSDVPPDFVIHRNNLGKYTTGQLLARATMAEVFGATSHGLKPVRFRWSNAAGDEITMDCDSLGTMLVNDLSGVISTVGLANMGFWFDDGSDNSPWVTTVDLTGLSAKIKLSSRPNGSDCKLGYAIARDTGAGDQDGPVVGARGTIRDDAAHVRIHDGVAQYGRLPSFIAMLPPPNASGFLSQPTVRLTQVGHGADMSFYLDADAGRNARIGFRTGGLDRWEMGRFNDAAEDLGWVSFDDAGGYRGSPLILKRDDGTLITLQVRPAADNVFSSGSPSYRWNVVYAATGAISTSDERDKQDIADISDQLLDAWASVEWKSFRFKDAIAEKGDAARFHLGAIAQQVRDTIDAHLGAGEAERLGLVCHDEWDAVPAQYYQPLDDEGEPVGNPVVSTPARPAGDRWGLRYDECFAVEAAYQRRRMDRLEAKVAGIG
jgi:hypothetical protein